MKHFIGIMIFTILGILMSACSSNKCDDNKGDSTANKMSPSTRIFMQELNKKIADNPNSKKDGSELNLPKEFVDKYKLNLVDGKYFISIMMKVSESASTAIIEKAGFSATTKAGNIWTGSVHIQGLYDLVMMDEIIYLQIQEAVFSD